MRLWSLHPQYLDPSGLVALWREGLLAQAVLLGKTIGYQHHPQLTRFRNRPSPVGAVAAYLCAVHEESLNRGYRFDLTKINQARDPGLLSVTNGQLEFEWNHLLNKLKIRDQERAIELATVTHPLPHPLFQIVPGNVEDWERGTGTQAKPTTQIG